MDPDEPPTFSDICDLCGQPLSEETARMALVPDSSSIHASDPKMDGNRLVTVCSAEHLTNIQQQYAQRPFIDAELWTGQIYRAMRAYPGGIKPKQLRRATGLTDQQIEAAMHWSQHHARGKTE
ncbi:hypothetical protein ACWC9H_27315 [Streptomyces sp. NPDC001251]